jgi:anti-sigma regulatory factor (Ser/Thr protein kinase)
LDDIGFFELYLGEKQFAYSSLRDTTIPLRNISYADHYGWLDEILLPWVSRTLQIYDKKGFGGFKTCIGEIFNNINDHSGEDIGCAFAQYFYKSHEIEIAISDFGVGIPHCIRKKEADCPNDAVALKLAVEEGYTTKTRPTNRGAGLETLSGFVVENNKGNMTIFSNRACLHCSPGKNGKEIITWNTSGFYPGTLIMITLKAGAIYEEIDEEDFLW